MTKYVPPLWVGPTALFSGFCLFFFGGIWTNYSAGQTSDPWIGYARAFVLIVGAVLILKGAQWTIGSNDDK